MKTIKFPLLTLLMIVFSSVTLLKAQSRMTAMDFTVTDCNGGGPHTLFTDLDAGKVVIIEYFMTSCSPCIVAADALEALKIDLNAQFPGKIKAYAFGFNNTYSCTTINNWVTTNGVTSIPVNNGATQVAYYGGMGMPTIVILGGGTSHTVLGNPYVGFVNSDTATMHNDIANFLNATSVYESAETINAFDFYPSPANNNLNLAIDLNKTSHVTIQLLDYTGRIVAELLDEDFTAGKTLATIDVSKYAQGAYLLKVTTGDNNTLTKKINIIK